MRTLFSVFGHKVTNYFLYLHPKSVLIMIKNKKWKMKDEINQAYEADIVKRR